jgi:hypothetical protein
LFSIIAIKRCPIIKQALALKVIKCISLTSINIDNFPTNYEIGTATLLTEMNRYRLFQKILFPEIEKEKNMRDTLSAISIFCFLFASDLPNGQQTSAQEKTEMTSMKVLLHDEAGKPVSGAKVHVSIWSNPPTTPNLDLVSDDQGIVEFERPAKLSILRIWASKEKYVPMFSHWERGHNEGKKIPASFNIVMPEGHRLGGKVVDDEGKPIAGARIGVSVQTNEPQTGVSMWLAEGNDAATTDIDGKWRIDTAPAPPDEGGDFKFSLFVTHPKFISDTKWRSGVVASELRDETCVAILEKGYRIKGIVKSHDGKPVDKGIVIWGVDPYMEEGAQEVEIGKDGSFETAPLAAGDWTLTTIGVGSAPVINSIELKEDTTLDVDLGEPNKLVVKVTDAEGNPIAKARLYISSWRNIKSLYNHKHPNVLESHIPREFDAQGVYAWDWAPDDEIKVIVHAEGFQEMEAIVFADLDEQEVVLTPEKK